MRFPRFILPTALSSLLLCVPAPAQTITAASGTFAMNFTIQAITPVPSGGQIWCHARFFATGGAAGSPNFYADGNVQAALSGKVYVCKLTVPFNWIGGVGDSIPTPFLAEAILLNAANTNSVLIQSDLAVLRLGYQVGEGPALKQGANGTLTFPTQQISL